MCVKKSKVVYSGVVIDLSKYSCVHVVLSGEKKVIIVEKEKKPVCMCVCDQKRRTTRKGVKIREVISSRCVEVATTRFVLYDW